MHENNGGSNNNKNSPNFQACFHVLFIANPAAFKIFTKIFDFITCVRKLSR